MKVKKEFYRNYVDSKIRVKNLIYYLILSIAFLIVLYDSFIHNLPFHYVLFVVVGRFMSLIMIRMLKLKKRETDNTITSERNIAGILVVVSVLFLRTFIFPKILVEFNVVFISDALLLILVGWNLGRVHLLSNKIEEMAYTKLMENAEKQ